MSVYSAFHINSEQGTYFVWLPLYVAPSLQLLLGHHMAACLAHGGQRSPRNAGFKQVKAATAILPLKQSVQLPLYLLETTLCGIFIIVLFKLIYSGASILSFNMVPASPPSPFAPLCVCVWIAWWFHTPTP